MHATPGPLPEGPEWSFEVKWDGVRLLADVGAAGLRLTTRTERDVTALFPELAGVAEIAPDVLLDGEVVQLSDGVPSFAALSERMHGPIDAEAARTRPVTFMVFDVLRLYGVPLLARSQDERRATLERLDLAAAPAVQLSPVYTDGAALLEATARRGMEGVVAKRRDAPYRPGPGAGAWVSASHDTTQACLVGGWRPDGASGRIELLLGVRDGHGLRYVGRVCPQPLGAAVQRALAECLVDAAADRAPFAEPVPPTDGAGARWCRPEVVVEVVHRGWSGGRVRRPLFRGVRDDLAPGEVVARR
jgi:bifunctional non-homologous end joining protein LigD